MFQLLESLTVKDNPNLIVFTPILESVKNPTDAEAAEPAIAKLLKEDKAKFLANCADWAKKHKA